MIMGVNAFYSGHKSPPDPHYPESFYSAYCPDWSTNAL